MEIGEQIFHLQIKTFVAVLSRFDTVIRKVRFFQTTFKMINFKDLCMFITLFAT